MTCRQLWLCLLVSAPLACADGAYIPPEYGTAESADQRACIIDHGATQTLIIETAYEGDLSDFAWVIPLPTLIQAADIGTVSQDLFRALEDLTAPRAWVAPGGAVATGGCGGCGGGTQFAGAPGDGRNQLGVTVWETLTLEGYEVVILSATQSADLAQWLEDNGYELPDGNEDTLQYYVDAGAFFVAVRVAPDQTAPAQMNGLGTTGALEPLRLTFPKGPDGLVFPLRISRASSKDETEVRLFVIDEHRVKSESYPTAQVNALGYDGVQDFAQWYDARFRAGLAGLGGRGFLVEYARPLPEWWAPEDLQGLLGEGDLFLTRLRSYLDPAQMTEDVLLACAPSDEEFVVDIVVGAQLAARGYVSLSALLLAGVWSLRARSRRARTGARLTALLGLLLLL